MNVKINKNLSKTKEFDIKSILIVLFAVFVVLILVYGIYSVFFSKSGFFYKTIRQLENKKDQNISVIGEQEIIPILQQQNIITGSQIDLLEKGIKQNEQISELNLFGKEIQVEDLKTGNSNPFKPFTEVIEEKIQLNKLNIEKIEKPIPTNF